MRPLPWLVLRELLLDLKPVEVKRAGVWVWVGGGRVAGGRGSAGGGEDGGGRGRGQKAGGERGGTNVPLEDEDEEEEDSSDDGNPENAYLLDGDVRR